MRRASVLPQLLWATSCYSTIWLLETRATNLAEIWGWPPEGTNPCRHPGRLHEDSRERFSSQGELSRLGRTLIEAGTAWGTSPHAIAAIRLLILTGCRSSEILKLRFQRAPDDLANLGALPAWPP